MFCPNCGTKNEDGAAFCLNCGTNLAAVEQENAAPAQSAAPEQPVAAPAQSVAPEQPVAAPEQPAVAAEQPVEAPKPPKEPRKPLSKGTKICIISGLVAVLAIVAFFVVGNMLSDYNKVAVKYVENYKSGDFASVYKNLSFPDGDFLTQDMFVFSRGKVTALEKVKGEAHKLTDIEKQLLEIEEKWNTSTGSDTNNDKKTVRVDYTYKNTNSETSTEAKSSMNVNLVKDGKVLFFFTKWTVDNSSYLSENYSVKVPKGSVVYIDGKQLEEKYKQPAEEDSNQDVYVIDKIFRGAHKIKVTRDIYEDYEEDFSISSANDGSFTVSSTSIKKEILETLGKQGEEDMKKFYEKVIAEAEFSELGFTVTNTEGYNENLEKTWNNFVSNQVKTTTNYALKSVEFTNVKGNAAVSNVAKGIVRVTVSMGYKGVTSYKDKEKNVSGTKSNTITYIYEDGQWKLYGYSVNYIR